MHAVLSTDNNQVCPIAYLKALMVNRAPRVLRAPEHCLGRQFAYPYRNNLTTERAGLFTKGEVVRLFGVLAETAPSANSMRSTRRTNETDQLVCGGSRCPSRH